MRCAPGVTGFPIEQIRQAIHPTGDQIALLKGLADASSKASAIISASCPSEPPLTSPARLDADAQRRLAATMQAIEIVRPALANLYNSLSDEQRQRLEAAQIGGSYQRRRDGSYRCLRSHDGRLTMRRPGRKVHQASRPAHRRNRQTERAAAERIATAGTSVTAGRERLASILSQSAAGNTDGAA